MNLLEFILKYQWCGEALEQVAREAVDAHP